MRIYKRVKKNFQMFPIYLQSVALESRFVRIDYAGNEMNNVTCIYEDDIENCRINSVNNKKNQP